MIDLQYDRGREQEGERHLCDARAEVQKHAFRLALVVGSGGVVVVDAITTNPPPLGRGTGRLFRLAKRRFRLV